MRHRALILLFLLPLATALNAQILGAQPFAPPPGVKLAGGGPPVSQPKVAGAATTASTPAIPPATLSQRTAIQDGATVSMQIITFARNVALETEGFRLNDWKRAESPQYAMFWNNWFNAQVHLGINYITGPAARSLANGTGWNSVPTGIRREAKDTFHVFENDDSEVSTGMIRIFGWRTRVYHYEIIPAAPGTPPQSQLVVVAGDGDRAYLFVLEGTSAQVNGLQDAFAALLIRLQPVGQNP